MLSEDWWKFKPGPQDARARILELVRRMQPKIVALVTHYGVMQRWTGENFPHCEPRHYVLSEEKSSSGIVQVVI
jgi:hypothetical protein